MAKTKDISAILAEIDADAAKKKLAVADDIKTGMDAKKEEMRELAKKHRDEMKVLEDAYDKLADSYGTATGKAVKKSSGGGGGARKARMPAERMETLIGLVKSELKKGKEYSAAEIADAIKATPDEIKSVMLKAKKDGTVIGNGKVGKAGRSKLA